MVAKDTDEVQFSAKRRRFLVDQGYEFHVIPDYTSLIPPNELKTMKYYASRDQKELLSHIKRQSDEAGLDEVLEIAADDLASEYQKNKQKTLERKDNRAAGTEKEEAPVKHKNALFKAWHR